MKLKSVHYIKCLEYTYAIEVYDDYSIKAVPIKHGVSRYILEGELSGCVKSQSKDGGV